jgi:MFS family permease
MLKPANARLMLALLSMINLLNYADRYIASALKQSIKSAFHLSDTQTAFPASAFVGVYMVMSPILATLGDRMPRRGMLACAVVLWSGATLLGGFAQSFETFVFSRALVGIGEAAYVSICPSIIADLFYPRRRSMALGVFYATVPVGVALGFSVSGLLAQSVGWRGAFGVFGLPGPLLAIGLLATAEPVRGGLDSAEVTGRSSTPSWSHVLKLVLASRGYVLLVIGYTSVTFASGILGDWFVIYMSRCWQMSIGMAASTVGMSVLIGGTLGTLLGGSFATVLDRRLPNSGLAISSVATIGAAAAAAMSLLMISRNWLIMTTVLTQLFMWMYNGPVNAALISAVPSRCRARAFAISVLVTHVFGDMISPPIVGVLADHNLLRVGLVLAPLTMLGGGLAWAYAWWSITASAEAVTVASLVASEDRR